MTPAHLGDLDSLEGAGFGLARQGHALNPLSSDAVPLDRSGRSPQVQGLQVVKGIEVLAKHPRKAELDERPGVREGLTHRSYFGHGSELLEDVSVEQRSVA